MAGDDHADHRPTTVVHLITTLTQGGAERALSELVPGPDEAEARSERHVVISLARGGMFADVITARGVEVRSLDMRPGRDLIRGGLRLLHHIRDLRPDMIIAWMYHAMFLAHLVRTPVHWAGVRTRQAWVLQGSLHTTAGLPWHTRAIIWLLAKRSATPDVIAINSETGRSHHEHYGYRPRRWADVPSGCDTDAFCPGDEDRYRVRRELGIGDSSIVAISVARDHPQKDHPTMLKAVELAREAVPSLDLVLVLVGTNTERYSREAEGTTRILGLGEQLDVIPLLRAADIVLSSSITEGMPNALLEAMAVGLPAAVTDVGDCRQAVGPAGHVVEPNDADALADAIVALSTLPESERDQLGKVARLHIIERFGVGRARDAYRSLWVETDEGIPR